MNKHGPDGSGCKHWLMAIVPELRGYTIEWIEPDLVLLSRKNRIYRAATPTGKRELVGKISAQWWKRAAAQMRLGQRLFRFMVYNIIPLSNDTLFVTFGKQLGIISEGAYYPLYGIVRPYRVLRGGCALARDGAIYSGEYIPNSERDSIRVYRYIPGAESVEVVYTFPQGRIRHVHGIYTDPYTDTLWCATGDLTHECKIIRTADGFRSLEIIGEGDETWRAVSLVFTQNAIFYASDAEFHSNFIYRLDRRTGERTELAEIDGPVYYSRGLDDNLFFGVTAELCPSQKGTSATLWHVDPAGNVNPVFSADKDLIHSPLWSKLFMHGTLHFPSGGGLDGETYIHGVGLRGIENQTLRLYRRG